MNPQKKINKRYKNATWHFWTTYFSFFIPLPSHSQSNGYSAIDLLDESVAAHLHYDSAALSFFSSFPFFNLLLIFLTRMETLNCWTIISAIFLNWSSSSSTLSSAFNHHFNVFVLCRFFSCSCLQLTNWEITSCLRQEVVRRKQQILPDSGNK